MNHRSEEDFRRDLGARIRAARGDRTLNEFSELVEVHPSQVSRFEKGERLPDATTLLHLAEALGVTADWILSGREGVEAGAIPAPLAPPPCLDLTLPGFLAIVSESGFARWAAGARKDDVPTVEDALRAIDALRRKPELSGGNGEPVGGWPTLLRSIRSAQRVAPVSRATPEEPEPLKVGTFDPPSETTSGTAYRDEALTVRAFDFEDLLVLPDGSVSLNAQKYVATPKREGESARERQARVQRDRVAWIQTPRGVLRLEGLVFTRRPGGRIGDMVGRWRRR